MVSTRFHLLAISVLATALLLGCRVNVPNLRLPPGYIHEQQMRATIHDPYGVNEGVPEIDGGRPLGYVQPRAQEVQSQWQLDLR